MEILYFHGIWSIKRTQLSGTQKASYLKSYYEFTLSFSRQVHITKLSFTKWFADIEVVQRPFLPVNNKIVHFYSRFRIKIITCIEF